LWNLFAQDEFPLSPALRLTLGVKAEHNSYTGLEWLPNARLAWQTAPDQLVWLAASRTVRTPARVDREVFTPQLNLGGPNFLSEVAQVYEAGFRSQPATGLSYSFTLFHHDFERLRSLDVTPAGLAFGNSFRGHLNGFEGWGRWRINDRWRLQAGYVHQKMTLGAREGAVTAPAGIAQLGNDPRSRGKIGVSWDFAANMELDLHARYVGALPSPAVPSYTAVDLRWGWRVRPDLELSLSVRNLTDRRHAEWGNAANRAEIERSVFFKAVWRM
jgi:iron complex outermembrane recepter protein